MCPFVNSCHVGSQHGGGTVFTTDFLKCVIYNTFLMNIFIILYTNPGKNTSLSIFLFTISGNGNDRMELIGTDLISGILGTR